MRNPSRPSILDQVTLSDGRLAWPVAKARGMSDPAFRGRLKRLSPDEAALGPFESRGPSRVAERAASAAAFAAAKADERALSHWPPALDLSHPDYSGVLFSDGSTRLIVSPRGAAYDLQEFKGGVWRDFKSFKSASPLRAFVAVIMFDPPQGLSDAVGSVPDDPRQCKAVPIRDG